MYKRLGALLLSITMLLLFILKPIYVYADYSDDDEIIDFLVEYVRQRNAANMIKEVYDEYVKNGLSLETAFNLAVQSVAHIKTDITALKNSIVNTWNSLTNNDRENILNVYDGEHAPHFGVGGVSRGGGIRKSPISIKADDLNTLKLDILDNDYKNSFTENDTIFYDSMPKIRYFHGYPVVIIDPDDYDPITGAWLYNATTSTYYVTGRDNYAGLFSLPQFSAVKRLWDAYDICSLGQSFQGYIGDVYMNAHEITVSQNGYNIYWSRTNSLGDLINHTYKLGSSTVADNFNGFIDVNSTPRYILYSLKNDNDRVRFGVVSNATYYQVSGNRLYMSSRTPTSGGYVNIGWLPLEDDVQSFVDKIMGYVSNNTVNTLAYYPYTVDTNENADMPIDPEWLEELKNIIMGGNVNVINITINNTPNNPDPTPDPTPNPTPNPTPDPTPDFDDSGIIFWLKNIWQSIIDLPSQIAEKVGEKIDNLLYFDSSTYPDAGVDDGFSFWGLLSGLLDSIVKLPGQIADAIGSAFNALGGVVSILENILDFLTGLVDGVFDFIKSLFIPSDGFIDGELAILRDKIDAKIPIIGQVIDMSKGISIMFSNDVIDYSVELEGVSVFSDTGISPESLTGATNFIVYTEDAPKFEITMPESMGGGTYEVIDFSFFDNYRGYVHGIIIAIASFATIRKALKKIQAHI